MSNYALDLSIIVPVYNVEQYLSQCVDSLICQDILSYEIILVDDGSIDASGELCDKYANDYGFIRTIHKTNGGLGSARNAGMYVANGEYIFFVDSDDYLEENCLAHMLYEIKQDNLDILLFGAESISENDETIVCSYMRKSADFNTVMPGVDAISKDLQNGEYLTSVCLRIMKHEYIKEKGFFFNEMYIHEDEDFAFLTYIQAHRVKILPNRFYKRRYRTGSIMSTMSFERSFEGCSYAAESIFMNSRKFDKKEKSLCEKYHNIIVLSMVGRYCCLNKDDRAKYRTRIKEYIKGQYCIWGNWKLWLAKRALIIYEMIYRVKHKLMGKH